MTLTSCRSALPLMVAAATAGLLVALAIIRPEPVAGQNSSPSGTISGRVTVDQGEIRAFRIKARDTDHRIIYTVFTTNGRYSIFNLPPGNYEVQALEIGFDSPVQRVLVRRGETKAVDLALKANGVRSPRGEGGFGPGGTSAYSGSQAGQSTPDAKLNDVELVEFDTLYPPGPARDVMMNACFGCHGANGDSLAQRAWHRRPSDERGWRTRIDRMFIGGKGGQYGQAVVTADYMSA